MSEYQYYEFQAIDRPLTSDELAYVRTLSRRVQATSADQAAARRTPDLMVGKTHRPG